MASGASAAEEAGSHVRNIAQRRDLTDHVAVSFWLAKVRARK